MKIVLMAVAGVVLFLGTAVGLLAAQGRLNYDGTRGIPVLHSFFPPGEAEGEGDAAGEGDGSVEGHAAGEDPARKGGKSSGPGPGGDPAHGPASDAGHGQEAPKPGYHIGRSVIDKNAKGDKPVQVSSSEPEQGHGEEGQHGGEGNAPNGGHEADSETSDWERSVAHGEDKRHRPGRLFEFPMIQAGISVAELNEILRKANEARHRAENELAAIAKREADLDAREADVKVREEQILGKIREIEQVRAKLDERIAEFHRTVTMIEQDEVKTLKADAATLAAFDAQFAAKLILQWWKTDTGQQKAVKILNVMDGDAANAILATMDAEQAREILDKRSQAVQATPPR